MYRYFLLFLLSISYLSSENIHGLIFNEYDDPVSFVIVHNLKNDSWTVGNEAGEVILNGALGDTIIVSRYGYEPVSLTLTKSDFIITLHKDPIQLDNVQANATNRTHLAQNRSTNTKHSYTGKNSSIYQSVPSIQVRTYGGHAGNATISIDGGPGSQTKVVYEGIDITSPQNGESDVSQIPPELIGSVSSAIQPGVHYGSGTTDGIVYLKNKNQKNWVSFGVGSWDRMNWSAKTSIDLLNTNGSFAIGQRFATDDYTVKWREYTYQRDNNDFLQSFASGTIQKMLMEKVHLKSVLFFSDQERGVAGLVQSPNTDARRNDHLFLGLIKGVFLIEQGYICLDLLTRQSQENYIDPNLSVDSNHELLTNSVNAASKLKVGEGLILLLNGNYSFEEINSTDTDHHQRQNMSTFISLSYKPTLSIKITPSIRYDQIGEDHSVLTMNGDFLWKQSNSIQHFLSVGNGFNSPTFNDMYWVPGGDLDLKPETSNKAMYLLTWEKEGGHVDLKIRHVDSKNLIVWASGENFWSPKNISSSSRSSMTLSGNISLSSFDLSGHISRLWTQDHLAEKPLRYAPEWSGSFQIQTSYKKFIFGLSGRYTGERIAMYDFPNDEILSSHFIPSVSISRNFAIKNRAIVIRFSTDNLLDNNFETIYGYPEPGRSIYLNFTIH